MAMDPIEQRIAEESAKIKAESYQKVASLGGWSGGGRTLWAISVLGAISGAAIGVVAPFFPWIAGASLFSQALSAVPASLAVFTATGMTTGFSIGAILGRMSGTAAAVAQEQEKRTKEWMARQMLAQNPDMTLVPDAPEAPAPEKPFWQRLKDNYRTYFNPRVGLLFTAIGVAGGLIMAAAFLYTGGLSGAIMPALGALTGLPETTFAMTTAVKGGAAVANLAFNPVALVSYTAGVMGAFGALWHFNYPKIASNMTHFFGEVMSGKPLGREWGPKEPEKIHSQTQVTYNQDVAIADGILSGTRHQTPDRQQFSSFQDMVSQQVAAADLGMKR